MKLIYLTANLPHGASEAFIIPEIKALMRLGHDVLIVPRSLNSAIVHGEDLLGNACRQGLCSREVVTRAVRVAIGRPIRVSRALGCLLTSRSPIVAVKNIAVVPKALWLSDLAMRFGADHIHCHWAATTATVAMLASKLSGIPWSLTAHRGDVVENNLLEQKLRTASFVRFISNDGLRLAGRAAVNHGDNVRVLHMGVDIPKRADWRPPRAPVVICPARFSAVKGHKDLIEAWRILRDQGVVAELWLAGENEDAELKTNLEKLVEAKNLRDSVKFLGNLPHDALLRLYETSSISLVVLPSVDFGSGNHEGIPVALIEAMSYGVPVIATRTGAIEELVVPGTGVLIPPEEPIAIAGAIQNLLEKRSLSLQIGANGRRRVVEGFDVSQIATALAAEFARAIPALSSHGENVNPEHAQLPVPATGGHNTEHHRDAE